MRAPRILLIALVAALASGGCAFIERVDVDIPNAEPVLSGSRPSISADGRFITFSASVQGGGDRVFVRDLQTDTTENVSIAPFGAQAFGAGDSSISSTGRWVAYTATPSLPEGGRIDVFLYDRQTSTTTRVTTHASTSTPNAWAPAVSVDGEKVAFLSGAPNIVPGDTNGVTDLFVWSRSTGTTQVVSRDAAGAMLTSPSHEFFMNDSGRFITWSASGDIFVRDLLLSTSELINPGFGPGGPVDGWRPSISENARYVAFNGDADGTNRTWRFDRTTDTLITVSLSTTGSVVGDTTAGPISGDGTMVIFTTSVAAAPADVNPGYDLYVRDVAAGRTRLLSSDLMLGDWVGDVSPIQSTGSDAGLSRDGSFAVFVAAGTGLVDGETNGVYVRSTRHVTLTKATPNALADGTTTVVELTGTGFRPDTQIGLSGDARERWNVTLVHYLDEKTMHITVQIVPGAAPGPVSVVAINPGNGWGPYNGAANWCLGCLTIT